MYVGPRMDMCTYDKKTVAPEGERGGGGGGTCRQKRAFKLYGPPYCDVEMEMEMEMEMDIDV